MNDIIHRSSEQAERIEADWGDLTWWAKRSLGNSMTMTVGRCRIRQGSRKTSTSSARNTSMRSSRSCCSNSACACSPSHQAAASAK